MNDVHLRRARFLDRLCRDIAKQRAQGLPRMISIDRALNKFRRSNLARCHGLTLSNSSLRDYFSRWEADPGTQVFRDGRNRRKNKSVIPGRWGQQLLRRAIRQRLTIKQLFRKLRAQDFTFSYATLCRRLPQGASRLAREVREAYLAYQKHFQRALREVGLR